MFRNKMSQFLRNIAICMVGLLALTGVAKASNGPVDQDFKSIDQNKLGDYALVVVQGNNYDQLKSVDGILKPLFGGTFTEINLIPAPHTVGTLRFNNRMPVYEYHTFMAKPGYRYEILRDGHINVSKRDDQTMNVLYQLADDMGAGIVSQLPRLIHTDANRDLSDSVYGSGMCTGCIHVYITPEEKQQFVKQQEDKQLAQLEVHKKQQPLVRKLGAKICKKDVGYIYTGYVEQVTDDKVKVSLASAVDPTNAYPRPGFAPSMIWDNPDKWDLCE